MAWPIPLPAETGDEAADLSAFAAWEQEVERCYYPDRFGPDGIRLPKPREFTYYLGVPEPSWLGNHDVGPDGAYLCSGVPKFVSAARMARYRTDAERWPVASACTYAIDSGAYIALNGTNTDVPWYADPDTYGGMILRFISNNGYPPDFCAPQDWPCEPPVRAKTGLTVRQHQQYTLDSYLWLVREFYMVPWIPVLQGWDAADYLDHERMYLDAGVDLAAAHRVGIGSICRRGHLPAIVDVVEQFADRGYRLHGFGIKTTALPIIGHLLRSADSMAWSFNARHSNIRLPECTHAGDCRNCYRYAVQWREQVLASLASASNRPAPPPDLFEGLADFSALFSAPPEGPQCPNCNTRLVRTTFREASSRKPAWHCPNRDTARLVCMTVQTWAGDPPAEPGHGDVTKRRAVPGDGPPVRVGDVILGVYDQTGTLPAIRGLHDDFTGRVTALEEQHCAGDEPQVTVQVSDGTRREFPADTWFLVLLQNPTPPASARTTARGSKPDKPDKPDVSTLFDLDA